jgi:hypothetical protein
MNVIAFDDNVAWVYSDAKQHSLVIGFATLARCYFILHIGRALHGIDHAAELHKDSVAHGLDQAPPVLVDGGAYNVVQQIVETGTRTSLIRADHPAVANDIASKNRRQPSLNAFFGHYASRSRFIGEILCRGRE